MADTSTGDAPTTTTTTTNDNDESSPTIQNVQEFKEKVKAYINNNPDGVWGDGSGDTRTVMLDDDAQLNRILVARKFHEKDSIDLFVEQVRFRSRWKPLEIQASDIPHALPSGAWRLCGYSKEGYVVSNYKLSLWDPDAYGDSSQLQEAIDEYTRYILYMVELMIGRMMTNNNNNEKDQFMVLFDLTGFYYSMVTRTNIRLMIRKLIYVAQTQYPERLAKVLLVNAPFGFETAWSMIRILLDPKTASKVRFVSTPELLEDIDEHVLSVTYDGTHEEYPIPTQSLQDEIQSFSNNNDDGDKLNNTQ